MLFEVVPVALITVRVIYSTVLHYNYNFKIMEKLLSSDASQPQKALKKCVESVS